MCYFFSFFPAIYLLGFWSFRKQNKHCKHCKRMSIYKTEKRLNKNKKEKETPPPLITQHSQFVSFYNNHNVHIYPFACTHKRDNVISSLSIAE